MIKFLKKGLKVDEDYFPCWYSQGHRVDNKPTITVYIKDYKSLPDCVSSEFTIENYTNLMVDHFEKDKIRIPENHPRFLEVQKLV
jgi:hypothetical protein